MAQTGGAHGLGTVFSFNPGNNAETTLWSLGGGFDGSEPEGDLLLYDGAATGINAVSDNYPINLYPNPGNGSFILQTQGATGAHYRIYNTQGDAIQEGTIQGDIQNISIGNAAPGLYVLMLNVADAPVAVRFAVAR
jgi:uncharacterized repeat protein (TIGR03803 family)